MYFNAPRLQQRVPIKKNFLREECPQTPLAGSRLRHSIGKFQFLLAKLNPMPVFVLPKLSPPPPPFIFLQSPFPISFPA